MMTLGIDAYYPKRAALVRDYNHRNPCLNPALKEKHRRAVVLCDVCAMTWCEAGEAVSHLGGIMKSIVAAGLADAERVRQTKESVPAVLQLPPQLIDDPRHVAEHKKMETMRQAALDAIEFDAHTREFLAQAQAAGLALPFGVILEGLDKAWEGILTARDKEYAARAIGTFAEAMGELVVPDTASKVLTLVKALREVAEARERDLETTSDVLDYLDTLCSTSLLWSEMMQMLIDCINGLPPAGDPAYSQGLPEIRLPLLSGVEQTVETRCHLAIEHFDAMLDADGILADDVP